MESNDWSTGKYDVLLEIWSNLELPDLTSCARVCVSWNDLLSKELVWNRLLEKKKQISVSEWKKTLRHMLKIVELKRIFLNGRSNNARIVQAMFSNWESGSHVIHECQVEDPTNKDQKLILQYKRLVHVDHDYFVSFDSRARVLLFDRVSRNLEKKVPIGRIMDTNVIRYYQNLIFNGLGNKVYVYNSKTGSEVTRLHIPNYADVRDLFVTCTNRLVVFSDMNAPEGPQLQVWQMNGRKFKEVYSKQYVAFLTRMRRPVEMDDRYISLGAFYRERSEVSEIHFMSTKTMKVERTLSVKTTRYRYESGLFFYVTGDVICVLDVASGKHVGRLPGPSGTYQSSKFSGGMLPIRMNSDWLVLLGQENMLHIFRLEHVIEANMQVVSLSNTIELEGFAVEDFVVDETEIVVMDQASENVHVIDFLQLNEPAT